MLQDLDLYDESRTLLHSGQLARRYTSRTEVTYTWVDLHVALLDNYRTHFMRRGTYIYSPLNIA